MVTLITPQVRANTMRSLEHKVKKKQTKMMDFQRTAMLKNQHSPGERLLNALSLGAVALLHFFGPLIL